MTRTRDTRGKAIADLQASPNGYHEGDTVHVRSARPRVTLCGLRDRSTVGAARGYWGPGGSGWPQVCRSCAQLEQRISSGRVKGRGQS